MSQRLQNDLVWSGLKMKPIYNYINGILKISDANFKNNNRGKILYYTDKIKLGGKLQKRGYKVRDYPLSSPPSLITSQTEAAEIVETFDIQLVLVNGTSTAIVTPAEPDAIAK